ncbi:hypothetical protein IV203_013866 [Nitzschia inconspicua]|uniref:Uncharacterized protein n=1 Tax=Nitzschia inconspicua TaxID=303405 RepID=A0A9K3Q8C8_9STRA|nr:hypothetical protein IV203_013866 [Nitzschia inconspicua]
MRLPVPETAALSRSETPASNDKLSGDSTTSISMTSSDEDEAHHHAEHTSDDEDDEEEDSDEEYEVELNDKEKEDDNEDEDADADRGSDMDDNRTQSSEDMSVASFSAINFTEFVEMYEIDCEYSPEEEAIMWFTSDEYAQFLEQCEERANEITKQHEAKGEEVTTQKLARDLLGLEAWTKEGYKKRQKARLSSIDVVLDEQFSQWDNGKEDPESIAELYRASTAESAINANTKAVHLEKDVKGFLQSTLKNYDVVRSMSTASLSSFRSTSSCSIGSLTDDDIEDKEEKEEEEEEEDENVPKEKVVKKKVVKKKSADSGWTKIDPNAPQPYNKYVKKKVPPKKHPSSDSLLSHSSNHSLMSTGSARSINSSDSRRGPVNLTLSLSNSIRSMGSRSKAPPKNKSLGGRRKPEALAAASRLQRQSGSRTMSAPKKHQPLSSRSLTDSSKKLPLKKKPQLNTVSITTTTKPNGATAMRLPLSKSSKPKNMKFTRSEVLPAYTTPVSADTDRKNLLAKKKQSLEQELKMIEKEMKTTKRTSLKARKPDSVKKAPVEAPDEKKKGGLFSKRFLLGKG